MTSVTNEAFRITLLQGKDSQPEMVDELKAKDIRHLSIYITDSASTWEKQYSYADLPAIFAVCPNLECVWTNSYAYNSRINLLSGFHIPLSRLPKLKTLRINSQSSVQLPETWENAPQLESLSLNIPADSPGLRDLIEKFSVLKNLCHFQPPKTDNLELLRQLPKLPALETLDLSSYITLPASVSAIVELLKPLLQLKHVVNFYPKKNESLTDVLLQLDFLDKLELLSTVFKDVTNLPVFFSQFKHVNLYHNKNRVAYKAVNTFREKYGSREMTDRQRELLFLCWTKSWHRVKNLNKNPLLEKHNSPTPITLAGFEKLPSLNKTTLKSKLGQSPFTLNPANTAETIWIVHNKSVWEDAENAILTEKPFVTEEQLTEYLHFLEKPYLLETDNRELSQNIVRLLLSSDADNLQLAFEMIKTGGATLPVQSMIAAMALHYRDEKIRKQAKQLYIKVGNPAFVPLMSKSYYKRTDYELRLSKHEAVSRTDFLLMIDYLEYTYRNTYRKDATFYLPWENLGIQELSESLLYFPSPSIVRLGRNPELNGNQAIGILSQLSGLKTLRLDGCRILLPPQISQLSSLEFLDICNNRMEDFSVLKNLRNLQKLYVAGCNVKNWDWLAEMPQLKRLYVSKADRSKIPHKGEQTEDGKVVLKMD